MTKRRTTPDFRWANKTIVRRFIYCPALLGPTAGLKYTDADYKETKRFCMTVAKMFVVRLCHGNADVIRDFVKSTPELAMYSIATMEARTPPIWSADPPCAPEDMDPFVAVPRACGGSDIPNLHRDREQVYSRHCTRLALWDFRDYMLRLARDIDRARAKEVKNG